MQRVRISEWLCPLALVLMAGFSEAQGTWTQVGSLSPYGLRSNYAQVYDSVRDRTVVYGGASVFTSGLIGGNDLMVEWNGSTWSQVPLGMTSPGARQGASMAYAPNIPGGGAVIFLFGGITQTSPLPSDQLWMFDVGTLSWSQVMFPTGAPMPAGRSQAGLAWDKSRQVLVLHGGKDAADTSGGRLETWEFDPVMGQWNPKGAGPQYTESRNAPLVYHEAMGQCVIFGGYGGSTCGSFGFGQRSETAAWDGMAWSQVLSAQTPDPRQDHAMTYDAAGQRVLMMAGFAVCTNPQHHVDMWALDASGEWTPLIPMTWLTGAGPGGCASNGCWSNRAMSYDSTHDRTVFFGPSVAVGVGFQVETWTYQGQPAPTPAYPGTGDDLCLLTGVSSNTHVLPVLSPMPDIKPAFAGELVLLRFESPNLTYVGEPLITGFNIGQTGNLPPPVPALLALGVYLAPPWGTFTFIFIPVVLPGGTQFAFIVPTGTGVQGSSLLLQGGVMSPGANNGIAAVTNAHEIQFQ